MMRIALYLAVALVSAQLSAQKQMMQSYADSEITGVYINSNEIFEIRLTAKPVSDITVTTLIEGETFESSLLQTVVDDGILKITTGRTPDFIPFNDKLSAHKVLSIVLEITLPEGLDVDVYSTLAGVDGTGRFGQVQMNLGRGGCRLEEFRFRESGKINTLTGSITIATKTTTVTAQSRNGTVVIPKSFPTGEGLMLQSVDGDITVRKSE
ncbi:hypothetical protein EAX61_02305 [Dokdonia sinensis]|uniref:Adhesin domain-containing protein n=1 Tax=Dokdonia sinensis TaxID=2479847 RepID=A0A3M0GFH9_9FLAO|nr:hypothetical protein [Dokdonia sinensis]RMB63247.1 hypothetical protein EAX61_02305 [Dokdonia sinensis]